MDLDQLLAQQAAGFSAGVDDLGRMLAARASGAGEMAANPTDDMSTLDRLRAGIGMGMAKTGRAVGQAIGYGIDAIAPKPQMSLSDLVTGKRPQTLSERLGFPTQSSIDEANRLDASLNNTTAGKVGGFIGQTTSVLPAALIPGVNTYLGATAVGAGVGGLTTEGDLKDRARGAFFGGLGGLAAKGLGDAAGAGLDYLAARRAAAQVQNAGRDTAAAKTRAAGYVIPPADTNPTVLNEVLNGISGKIKTAQTASARNQSVTNELARSAIGAPTDQPLTLGALDAIRKNAGQAYDAVSNAGTITPGKSYEAALDQIAAPFKQAASGFPNAAPSPVIAQIEALRSPQFDAGSAVSMIRQLRSDADKAFSSGDKATGGALKNAAGALENAIEDHLSAQGAPAADMLKNFRDARQLIAKTYTVQKALNGQTGDVSAPVIAAQLAKGKPLSGDLLTIGQSAQAFPKALQSLKEAPKQFSPLDFMGGLVAAAQTGHPAAALLPVARPALRMGLLSDTGQLLGVPSYSTPVQGLLSGALNSPILQQVAPVQGGLLASRAMSN